MVDTKHVIMAIMVAGPGGCSGTVTKLGSYGLGCNSIAAIATPESAAIVADIAAIVRQGIRRDRTMCRSLVKLAAEQKAIRMPRGPKGEKRPVRRDSGVTFYWWGIIGRPFATDNSRTYRKREQAGMMSCQSAE